MTQDQDRFLKELFDLCDRYHLEGVRCLSKGTVSGTDAMLLEIWVPSACLQPQRTIQPKLFGGE